MARSSAVLDRMEDEMLGTSEGDDPVRRVAARVMAFLTHWAGMGLVTGLLAAGGGALGGLAAWLDHAPPLESFENYRPPQATVVLDANGAAASSLFEQRRHVVRLQDLPPHVPESFIGIEDRRFFEHIGVDPPGVARAAATNLRRGSMAQGASTITQQLARNLLAEVGRERTLMRKVRELLYSLQLERQYTKDQILEVYLNQIYLGSGAWGVEAAARAYFGKSAAELSVAEAALLAGLPQLPERYSPLNNIEAAEKRRDQVLQRLHAIGYLDDREYDQALGEQVQLDPLPASAGRSPYFVDAVRRRLSEIETGNERDDPRQAGWTVRTTLDSALQDGAELILREGLEREEREFCIARQVRFAEEQELPEFSSVPAEGQRRMARVVRTFERSIVVELPGGWRADIAIPEGARHLFIEEAGITKDAGVDIIVDRMPTHGALFQGTLMPRRRLQGAVVVLETRTGAVRALVGGHTFSDRANGGMYNRAVLARRQAGSTFKPIFFLQGLEFGFTGHSQLRDSPMSFPDGYTPRNYGGRYAGITSLGEALAESRNIATIDLVKRVGLRNALEYVARFQRLGSRQWALPLEWPVVLGTTEVTPLELAAAYQIIGNAGMARDPWMIAEVRNAEGREVFLTPAPPPERIADDVATAELWALLHEVMVRGTGRATMESLPEELRPHARGKTGTTNDNRDVWFAGFTDAETIVVWLGFDDPLPLGSGRTGGRAAGPLWGEIATAAWRLRNGDSGIGDQ